MSRDAYSIWESEENVFDIPPIITLINRGKQKKKGRAVKEGNRLKKKHGERRGSPVSFNTNGDGYDLSP